MIEVIYNNNVFSLNECDFQKLHSKNYGEKCSDFFLLNEFEVLYLLEKSKINVISKNKNKIKKLNFDDIKKLKKINLNIYSVYKDLKKKGYKIKSGTKYGFDFRVYDKNCKKIDHAFWLVLVISDTQKLNINDISSRCRISHSTRKDAIFAIVDKDFDVTYYKHSWLKL